MSHKAQISKKLKENIEELYTVFSNYPRPRTGIITCLDYGPTEEEALAFAKPLKEIPREYIYHCEFYDKFEPLAQKYVKSRILRFLRSFEDNIDAAEVKYLTPRILESYVETIDAQEYSNIQYCRELRFIRYMLVDLDKKNRLLKKVSKWNKNETACLKRYLLLLHEYLSILSDDAAIDAYLEFIDAICDVVEDISPYLSIWQKVPDTTQSKQIEKWLNTHINQETLELSPNNWSLDSAPPLIAERNQKKIMSWVLSDENITTNIELFSSDPWFKLALK